MSLTFGFTLLLFWPINIWVVLKPSMLSRDANLMTFAFMNETELTHPKADSVLYYEIIVPRLSRLIRTEAAIEIEPHFLAFIEMTHSELL